MNNNQLKRLAEKSGFGKGQQAVDEMLYDPNNEIKHHSRLDSNIDPLVEKIFEANLDNKRINGHLPEYYADCYGVDVDELFPPEGKTLNVGDPWQKLDSPGVINIDYEPGEIIEFQEDFKSFKEELNWRFEIILKNFEYEKDELDSDVRTFLENIIERVKNVVQITNDSQLYELPEISEEFIAIQKQIEAEIKRETDGYGDDPHLEINEIVRDLWYMAAHGTRAVDALDWETELRAKYEEHEASLPDDLSETERNKLLRTEKHSLIGDIRLHKRLEHAEFVQAIFPRLPFASNSFDSFVAFWSITTYVMNYLEYEEFEEYWEELYRVLKTGGKAYIYPLYMDMDNNLERSLHAFQQKHPDFIFEFRPVPYDSLFYNNHPEYLHIEKAENFEEKQIDSGAMQNVEMS